MGRKLNRTDDPVLAMLGVGQELWEHETGDQFVERIRSENLPTPPSPLQTAN